MTSKRVFLSSPHLSGLEEQFVADAFATNWVTPLGPHVDAFEEEFAAAVGARYAVAVSSGTAALHLALMLAGVGPGDEVLVSTLTFVASVNPIVYLGATPVFIDSERVVVEHGPGAARGGARRARAPGPTPEGGRARAPVRPERRPRSDQRRVRPVRCPADRGRGRGARRVVQGPRAGNRRARCGVFSFNGNKIITTAGGGMLVSADEALRRARAQAGHAGARPGAALRALGDRLQLPAEQRPRRDRARPAPACSRSASRRADGTSRSTARR